MHFDLYACVCLRAVDQPSTSDFNLHMPESLVIEDQLLIREITSLPILLLYIYRERDAYVHVLVHISVHMQT